MKLYDFGLILFMCCMVIVFGTVVITTSNKEDSVKKKMKQLEALDSSISEELGENL